MAAARRDLSSFAVTRRWPPTRPDVLQLYTLATPNGVKVSIMLEETGIAYEAHRVDFARRDQHSPEFLSLNPNGKIPAILDPDGPGGEPLGLYESGAILVYLADKCGRLLPPAGAARAAALQWVMWQMSSVGPMFGQVGYFHKFDGRQIEDKRPLQRYVAESARLLGVLDRHLAERRWVNGGDYSIADIALVGPIRNFVSYYDAGPLVGYDGFANVKRWLDEVLARPAVQRGLAVPV